MIGAIPPCVHLGARSIMFDYVIFCGVASGSWEFLLRNSDAGGANQIYIVSDKASHG